MSCASASGAMRTRRRVTVVPGSPPGPLRSAGPARSAPARCRVGSPRGASRGLRRPGRRPRPRARARGPSRPARSVGSSSVIRPLCTRARRAVVIVVHQASHAWPPAARVSGRPSSVVRHPVRGKGTTAAPPRETSHRSPRATVGGLRDDWDLRERRENVVAPDDEHRPSLVGRGEAEPSHFAAPDHGSSGSPSSSIGPCGPRAAHASHASCCSARSAVASSTGSTSTRTRRPSRPGTGSSSSMTLP